MRVSICLFLRPIGGALKEDEGNARSAAMPALGCIAMSGEVVPWRGLGLIPIVREKTL